MLASKNVVETIPANLLAGGFLYQAEHVLLAEQAGWKLQQGDNPAELVLVNPEQDGAVLVLKHQSNGNMTSAQLNGSNLLLGTGSKWEQVAAYLDGQDMTAVTRVQFSASKKQAVREGWAKRTALLAWLEAEQIWLWLEAEQAAAAASQPRKPRARKQAAG